MATIFETAAGLGLPPEALYAYGDQMAKLRANVVPPPGAEANGRIILVSAINPTRAGRTANCRLASNPARTGNLRAPTAWSARSPASTAPISKTRPDWTSHLLRSGLTSSTRPAPRCEAWVMMTKPSTARAMTTSAGRGMP